MGVVLSCSDYSICYLSVSSFPMRKNKEHRDLPCFPCGKTKTTLTTTLSIMRLAGEIRQIYFVLNHNYARSFLCRWLPSGSGANIIPLVVCTVGSTIPMTLSPQNAWTDYGNPIFLLYDIQPMTTQQWGRVASRMGRNGTFLFARTRSRLWGSTSPQLGMSKNRYVIFRCVVEDCVCKLYLCT